MSLWRQLTRGFRALTHRDAADRDVADEVRHYVDRPRPRSSRADSRRTRRGAPRELEIGNATVAREQVRAYGWENAIETLLADLRYALRRLRANPGSQPLSVLTLALGIGATTAIFSAVNPILFEPLPYPRADRWSTLSRLAGRRLAHRRRPSARTSSCLLEPRSFEPSPSSSRGSRRSLDRRTRTSRRAARQRELLPRARRRAGARPRFQRDRGRAGRSRSPS